MAWQWTVLARVAAAQQDRERAVEACREVSELPASPETYRRAAGVLASEGELTDALDLLERAVASGFDDADDLQSSQDLAALREDTRFAQLVEQVGE